MPTRDLVVDVVAVAGSHLADHTLPVWRALPKNMRGAVYTQATWFKGQIPPNNARHEGDVWLTASYADMIAANRADKYRPIIHLSHGAGQFYVNPKGVTHPSYVGSRDRRNIALYLNVNSIADSRNAEANPSAQHAVVGCPKLDRWIPGPTQNKQPVVAITFHWDCMVSWGTRSAMAFYRPHLPDFLEKAEAAGWRVILHSHPRMMRPAREMARELGVEFALHLDEVMEQADLLCADSTSAMYEFAYLDRPVVVMNQPLYYKEPDRGIRFWQHIPGPQVHEPQDLYAVVDHALEDPVEYRTMRRRAVEFVYPVRGNAAETAVHAVQRLVESDGEGLPTALAKRIHDARLRVMRPRKTLRVGRFRNALSESIAIRQDRGMRRT